MQQWGCGKEQGQAQKDEIYREHAIDAGNEASTSQSAAFHRQHMDTERTKPALIETTLWKRSECQDRVGYHDKGQRQEIYTGRSTT